MVISYATKSPTIYVPLTGTMTAEIYDLFNAMVDQATAAFISQPQTEAPELSFAAPGEEKTDSTSSYQLSLLLQSVKTRLSPASRKQGPKVGILDNKAASPQKWQSLVDLYLVVDRALKKDGMEILSMHEDLQSGRIQAINATHHKIDQEKGKRPIHQHPHRAGRRSREIICGHKDKQLKAGVIGPAQSEWAIFIVLVSMKNGSFRFCMDYQRLNAATIPDRCPLPRIHDCSECLGDSQAFTELEALWEDWKVQIDDENKNKITFSSHHGTCRYTSITFGLHKAGAMFPRALDIVLSGVRCKACIVNIDDIVIFPVSNCQSIQDIDEVLPLLSQAKVTLKLPNFHYYQNKFHIQGIRSCQVAYLLPKKMMMILRPLFSVQVAHK